MMILGRLLVVLGLWLGMLASAQAACSAGALPFNLQNNTVADATQVMANFNQIGTGVATNCAGSGANTDITSLGGLTTPLPPSEGGTWIWTGGVSTGTANAQVVATVTPATNFSLTQGKCINFVPGFTNTGATTLNVFSTGVLNLFRQSPTGPQAMTGGELVASQPAFACYDGTQYELLNAASQFGGFGPQTTLASAATTDLGTISSHNILISGVATITSLGSSASTTFPIYALQFSGVLTLTNNATSLILPNPGNITTAAGDTVFAQYLGAGNWRLFGYQTITGQPPLPPALRGYISGLILSGGGSQIISVASGVSTSDDQTTTMSLASAFTKSFSNWTVGTANGCLDTGTIAANTYYHIYEIMRVDTGLVDVLCSLQPTNGTTTSPTMPTNYTKKRRLGTIKTDATPNILSFFQDGDNFYKSGTVDFSSAVTVAIALTALNIPPGVVTKPIVTAQISGSNQTNPAATLSLAPAASSSFISTLGFQLPASATSVVSQVPFVVGPPSNISSQIFIGYTIAAGNPTGSVTTVGWVDTRGK